MNNIHEKDWAEDGWSGHTGMDTFSDDRIAGDNADEGVKDAPEAMAAQNGITTKRKMDPSP